MMIEKSAEHETGTTVVDDMDVSLWRRYRTTPWGDLLRGRLSGRYDVRARIRESGLPVEVCEFLGRVMKKVGLRGSERIDVVDELISHFQDGIGRGERGEELVKLFGEVKRVAKLIRRAKKRNRSLVWRAWVRGWQGAGVVFGLLVVWYVGALFYYFSGSVVISHDYLADITAKARAVPEGERAWPVYREALMEIQPDLDVYEGFFPGAYPGYPGWETTVAAINNHPTAMEELRRATKMAGLGYVVSRKAHADDQPLWEMGYEIFESSTSFLDDTVYGIPERHMSALRIAARLLVADIYIAVEGDDGDRVYRDSQALLSMIRHYEESPTWTSDMLSARFTVVTALAIGDVVATKPDLLSHDQLERMAHRLNVAGTDGQGGALRIRVEPSMNGLRDIIQRCYTDDGDGGGHLGVSGIRNLMSSGTFSKNSKKVESGLFVDPWIAATAVKRSVIEDWLSDFTNAYNAQLSKPMWEWSEDIDVDTVFAIREYGMNWSNRYSLLNFFWSMRNRDIDIGEIQTMRRDAMLAALALELYRRDHEGEYPVELAALVPKYMPKIPYDRFNGSPLGYKISDGKPKLYSVSINQRDDGGNGLDPRYSYPGLGRLWIPPAQIEHEENRLFAPNWLGKRVEIPRGDWILWEAGKTESEIHPRNFKGRYVGFSDPTTSRAR